MKTRAPNRTAGSRRKGLNSRRTGSSRSSRAGRAPRTATKRRAHSATLTTDHEEIRNWVEERGGHPATVKRTAKGRRPEGILRIDFPGFSGAGTLKEISWDEWFEIFEERRLGFLHQDTTASGKRSRFNKLVCRQ